MNKIVKNSNIKGKVHQFESDLNTWRAYQLNGERQGDCDAVAEGIALQIECLYYLNRDDDARAFLDNLPNSVDLDKPRIRELFVDTYVMADDVDYFYKWYTRNLSQREANEGDQVLTYALLCHNRNSEARDVFQNTFPALKLISHFTHALKHIPQIIEDRSQRELYYKAIVERCHDVLLGADKQSTHAQWYEILLKANYALKDIVEFKKNIDAMADAYPEAALQHVNFLERLQDINNPKWKTNKVFGVGLSKTGTASLSKALTLLHLSTAHWTNAYSHDLLVAEDVPLFDSLTDISISYQYKELYHAYPDAKFILTIRSIEEWKNSFLAHYARSMHAANFEDLKEIISNQYPARFGQIYVDIHQELYFKHATLEESYRAHTKGVIEFFRKREREDQLLILDVTEQNALQKLSEFLGVECLQSNFPYENTKEEKNSWMSPISGQRRVFKPKTL